MGRGYSGANLSATIDVTYEYAGSTFYDPNEFTDYLKMNLSMATDTKTYQDFMPEIGKLAVQFAQDFIQSNGTYRTGKLYNSVKWKPTSSGITLYADARDKYGSAYAGHIEYGFVGRDGMPHGPWPFLRPAIRMAAEASKGEIASTAAQNILYGRYDSKISFGRANVKNLLGDYNYGNRGSFVNNVRGGFRANPGIGRWRGAQHGIDHMGRLENDKSDSGKELYRSFVNNYGKAMPEWRLRRGEL